MEEQKNDKRTLSIELDNEVKKVSITAIGDNEKIVMKQELNEEELAEATGAGGIGRPVQYGDNEPSFSSDCNNFSCPLDDLKHISEKGSTSCINKHYCTLDIILLPFRH